MRPCGRLMGVSRSRLWLTYPRVRLPASAFETKAIVGFPHSYVCAAIVLGAADGRCGPSAVATGRARQAGAGYPAGFMAASAVSARSICLVALVQEP